MANSLSFLFWKRRLDKQVPKETWIVLEGIVVINLGMKDFSSLMRSCAKTQALESLSEGQTLSLSSCVSLLSNAMRL